MTQPSLFDAPEAERRKELGQALVVHSRTAGEWVEKAEGLVLRLDAGEEFTADDVIAFAGLPPSRNLVGATFSGWNRAGLILHTGRYVKSQRPGRQAGRNAVWKRTRK